MTFAVRDITPAKNKRLTFTNKVAYGDSGLLYMSTDRITFLGYNPANKLQLRYSINYDTNPATATWTNVFTFPDTAYAAQIEGVLETHDGEILVYINNKGSQQIGRIFKSSGWTTNRAGVVFNLVLTGIGGYWQPWYNCHTFMNGSDGVLLACENGPQTTAPNLISGLYAGRLFLSKDFGATWTQIFNIVDYGATQGVPNPLNVHLHGAGYDEEWQRIWVIYGDGTGDGKNIAGLNNTQVVYSDDFGVTWQKLPQPDYWTATVLSSGTIHQYIAVAFSAEAIVFTPDVSNPFAPLIFPRVGYRKLGAAIAGPFCLSGTGGTINHCALYSKPGQRNNEPARPPYLIAGYRQLGSSLSGTEYQSTLMLSTDLLEWGSVTVEYNYTAQTSAGFNNALGPSRSGKVYLITNQPINVSDRVIAGDLIFE